MKSFASDNYAPVIPEVLDYILKVNVDHARSYGADPYTEELAALFDEIFGRKVSSFLVFNGTGANLLGISSVLRPYESVICTDLSHLNVDESNAPQLITGGRLQSIKANDEGKLSPDRIQYVCHRLGDPHAPQPRVVSITQATEYGTVYSLDEIKSLRAVCDQFNLLLHVDGARLLNAACYLGVSIQQMITETGVDILSFGGTKAGTMGAEAVIFVNPELAKDAKYFHKRNTQLVSKNRYLAAQFLALLKNDCWMQYCNNANSMALKLATVLAQFPEVKLTQAIQANGVFAIFPVEWIKPLQEIIPFYIWDTFRNEVRLMCSWDTTAKDIDLLVAGIRKLKSGEI
jgi:threonine aldolase